MSMQGVAGEDKIQLSKEEALQVKLRSRKLLFSLIYPVRGRLLVSLLIVILSQALRVAGPFLIALSIDWALPAALSLFIPRSFHWSFTRNTPRGELSLVRPAI